MQVTQKPFPKLLSVSWMSFMNDTVAVVLELSSFEEMARKEEGGVPLPDDALQSVRDGEAHFHLPKPGFIRVFSSFQARWASFHLHAPSKFL